MKYVQQRNGVFRVRIPIPEAARHAFPELNKADEFVQSLRTKDEAEAFRLAPPIIANVLAQRDAALKPVAPAVKATVSATPAVPVFPRPEVERAVERWRVATINAAEAEHFNGVALAISPFGDEAMALSERRHQLSSPATWEHISDFDDRMREALASQGLDVPVGHPLLNQAVVRGWFGRAWASVEYHTEQFRLGVFKHWPEDATAAPGKAPLAAPKPLPAAQLAPSTVPTLSALLERFIRARTPKTEADYRNSWRRFVERFGDVPADTITAQMAEDFLIDLRRFPNVKRPKIAALPFDEILAKHADAGKPLSAPTVWKYFVNYDTVFEYAFRVVGIPMNPIAGVKPSKPQSEKEVRHYEPEEIKAIFSAPMFTGCSKTHTVNGHLNGYREEPGDIILKDGRYWMPILCLFHGNRMEEWGGAKVAHIKTEKVGEEEITYLDLKGRKLKAKRLEYRVPIHPHVVAKLGFLDYVEARFKAGEEYLFPEFPHDDDAEDPEASTRQFTKWFGLWCNANGFTDPETNFHSWRHTFKHYARKPEVGEISDLISGHSSRGASSVAQKYGRGALLKVLADAIAKVEYPTFPRLP